MIANQVARLTKLLDLNSAQQAQATSIFAAEHTALAGLRPGMDAARTALKGAVDTNSVGGIETAAGQIGDLTAQQISGQSKAEAGFLAILTPDQQSKYKELGPGPGNGPGGRGGGPGGMGAMGGMGGGRGGRGAPPPKPAQ